MGSAACLSPGTRPVLSSVGSPSLCLPVCGTRCVPRLAPFFLISHVQGRAGGTVWLWKSAIKSCYTTLVRCNTKYLSSGHGGCRAPTCSSILFSSFSSEMEWCSVRRIPEHALPWSDPSGLRPSLTSGVTVHGVGGGDDRDGGQRQHGTLDVVHLAMRITTDERMDDNTAELLLCDQLLLAPPGS